ncbi:SAM-dependent methyltransferase [Methylophaga sp. OBS3]|uniref:SAM-dependent methyltransferase n=1 Tax=Methylophaga sp. OBS3 TaxID=2991934 RepID=UPI00225B06D6|nr:cyclopropane-fatty-acyl-phospholipid synthase family protein [Methylophaga sp. OBS3]MCX4189436.1 cyclopropane-fatty-acyl-phospholipid synthase family protein [Methylophaga sp. OBS3]
MNRQVTTADKLEKVGRVARLYEKLVINQLSQIRQGCIYLHTANAVYELGDSEADLTVNLTVYDHRFFEAVVRGGSVGAAEAYMSGDWHCSDLTGLVRILVRNQDLTDDMEKGLARVAGWLMKGWHYFNRNSHEGSRKNIAAHYDLGNDLFELFLDRDWMMYSSALYYREDESLEQAQANKLKRLCDKLALTTDDNLLEIGTGWGGAAVYAASHYGCKVTTTTISKEQYAYATARVKAANLEDKVTVLLQDYRDLTGQYDKLISIEMVEAVGHHYIEGYFAKCSQLLKDDGLAIIQAITIEDHRYEQAVKSVDFIKRYIFPGSFIPSVTVLTNAAAKAKLKLTNLEDIGPSYAITLAEWRKRFMSQLDTVRQQGYPDSFIRMWEFYLCYCEGGFAERSIADVHLLFSKNQNRRPQWVPASVE